jgi:hypothetical protein
MRVNMNWIGKIRPQVLIAIIILGTLGYAGMATTAPQGITVGCIAGIIALAKDILQVDNTDGGKPTDGDG